MRTLRRLGLALALVGVAAGCTVERVDEAQVGVHYTQGPVEGEHFGRVLQPGDSELVFDDLVYKLPARQVSFISAPGDEADAPPLVFRARGGEELQVSLDTRFFLNSGPKVFKQFFLEICQKYECWDGATSGGKEGTNDGWGRMLRGTIGRPQQAVATTIGLEFDADPLRYDSETKQAFTQRFGEAFAEAQERTLFGSDYFCGDGYERPKNDEEATDCPNISVTITDIRYTNEDLETQRERRELAKQQETTAVAEERAAQAQQRVNAAKATDEFRTLRESEAILACAKNPKGCQLTVILGSKGDVTVSAN